MRKYFVFIFSLFFLINPSVQAQKYFTKTGTASFLSHTDAIDIDGINKQVGSFLNIQTGEIVFSVLIRSFEFTLATAEEHFNETYMESEKYPKASFKGKIPDITTIDLLKPGKYQVKVEGELTIHGVTKHITQPGTLEVKNGKIYAVSAFQVSIDDYNIKVPISVKDRVANTVDIRIEMVYEQYVAAK